MRISSMDLAIIHSMDALVRYSSRGFREVRGWLFPEAIALIRKVAEIQRDLGVHGPVGEIGIHHGQLFILLHLLTAKGERSGAWDLFEFQNENIDGSGKGDREIFLEHLRQHGCDAERVSVVTANSMNLDSSQVRSTLGGGARLFSVDGGHTAEITFHDLHIVSGALGGGGVLILDDFFNDQWPGVADGTMRFLLQHPGKLSPIAIGGNKLLFAGSKEFAQKYIQALSQSGLAPHKISSLAGEPVVVFSFPKTKGLLRFIASTRLWRKMEKRPLGQTILRLYRWLRRR